MKLLYLAVVALTATPAAAQVASRVVRSAPDSTFWPEGVDHDPTTGSYYLGGVRHGSVMRIDSLGRAKTFWSSQERLGSVLGVRVDARRRSLWITTSGIPQLESFIPSDTAKSSLIELSMDDARVLRRWDIKATAGNVLGDLAIGPDGDVFVTDSKHPRLYRLRPAAEGLDVYSSPLFRSLQGLAPAADGRTLFLADYSQGLLRVDLASGNVTKIGDAPGASSRGCDGIALHSQSLICVQNGASPARIMRFALDADGTAITKAEIIDRNSAIADEPTIGTMVGDEFVYVANSQWEKHDNAGVLLKGARLRGPILLGVKVP